MRSIKITLILLLFLLNDEAQAQNIALYKDSINKFEIGMPIGWNYQVINDPSTSIKLTVSRPKKDSTDFFTENYNVNVLLLPNQTLDACYSEMMKSISTRAGFRLISQGDTTIRYMKYKWLTQSHTNQATGTAMTAYIYLAYDSTFAYMITFAATTSSFSNYEVLFRQLSASFHTDK
ncbi:MAG: hypothetical protein EOO88_51935 [Pedobacter sp.]|nr:MAG: hypothetical protein EOO88_51935 [Pedobacter sp.]